jgi:phosphorylase kinase alpha/beta subunit
MVWNIVLVSQYYSLFTVLKIRHCGLANRSLLSSPGLDEQNLSVTVKDLLKGLYDKACQQKLWGLVRHTAGKSSEKNGFKVMNTAIEYLSYVLYPMAGMLGKRVEDLAKAVTDLLVRQKQVTVGMPPNHEITITGPLPENELRQIIHQAYGDDESTAMLTQVCKCSM